MNSNLTEHLIVEEHIRFTLEELSQACRVDTRQVVAFVEEGVLEPEGGQPGQWRFSGASLQRARTALRLASDFELQASNLALVLDLLDQIRDLRAELRRR